MTEEEKRQQRIAAIEQLLIGHCTEHLRDRYSQLAALRLAKNLGIEKEATEIFLQLRFAWIARKFIWQRQWQRQTRNRNKAKFHDSISLREKYMRCK